MSIFKRKNKEYEINLTTGESFTVNSKNTILQSALDQGIGLPHNCRVGTCTECKCKLTSGKVKELTDSAFVLSGKEIKQGYILACQCRALSDITIEVSSCDQVMPIKETSATIIDKKILTHDIVEVIVKPDMSMPFISGQYVDITTDEISIARSYSFADTNNDHNTLSFFIKKMPHGKMSNWFYDAAQQNDKVQLKGPFGNFIRKPSDKEMLCIAGGSGLAPIMSILYSLKKQPKQPKVSLLFGARQKRDLYYMKELAELKKNWSNDFQFTPVLSDENQIGDHWQGATGLVTEHINQTDFNSDHTQAFLCGPPAMVDAAIVSLKAAGISEENILFDKFENVAKKVA